MKRPLAYITAAWSGEHEKDGQRAAAIAALCMRRAFPALPRPLSSPDPERRHPGGA